MPQTLFEAAGSGTFKDYLAAESLLASACDPNERCSNGLTPVLLAASWGRYEILKLLLLNGGDPSLRDDEGRDALALIREYAAVADDTDSYIACHNLVKLWLSNWQTPSSSSVVHLAKRTTTSPQCSPLQLLGSPGSSSGSGYYRPRYFSDPRKDSPRSVYNVVAPTSARDNNKKASKRSPPRCRLAFEQLNISNNNSGPRSTSPITETETETETASPALPSDDCDLSLNANVKQCSAVSLATPLPPLESDLDPATTTEGANADGTANSAELDSTPILFRPFVARSAEYSSSNRSPVLEETFNRGELSERCHRNSQGKQVVAVPPFTDVLSSRENAVGKGGRDVRPPRENVRPTVGSTREARLSKYVFYTDVDIRKCLERHGVRVGPMERASREVYLRQLADLDNDKDESIPVSSVASSSGLVKELPPGLLCAARGSIDFTKCGEDERSVAAFFDTQQSRTWRGGNAKTSFSYLLIDPRELDGLHAQHHLLRDTAKFLRFLCAIFYVGKGKAGRQFQHLLDAVNGSCSVQNPGKIERIRDIWAAGFGVISLQISQNVIPVEAYTHEACVIDALGLWNLTNMRRGEYYGLPSTWAPERRRQLGAYLLHRAMNAFLSAPERQIRREDL